MTIDEAIAREREVAKEKRKKCSARLVNYLQEATCIHYKDIAERINFIALK